MKSFLTNKGPNLWLRLVAINPIYTQYLISLPHKQPTTSNPDNGWKMFDFDDQGTTHLSWAHICHRCSHFLLDLASDSILIMMMMTMVMMLISIKIRHVLIEQQHTSASPWPGLSQFASPDFLRFFLGIFIIIFFFSMIFEVFTFHFCNLYDHISL